LEEYKNIEAIILKIKNNNDYNASNASKNNLKKLYSCYIPLKTKKSVFSP